MMLVPLGKQFPLNKVLAGIVTVFNDPQHSKALCSIEYKD